MKIPEKPPAWMQFFRDMPQRSLEYFASEKGRVLMQKIDDDYLHWEKVKYRNIPPSIDLNHLWAIVKATRLQRRRVLPLLSTKRKFFTYGLPDSVHRELHFVDRFAGGQLGLETPGLSPDAKDRYLVSSLMEEAIASSQIEGAATTRRVGKEMLRSGRKPRDRAEQMILNNYRTIQRIKSLVDEDLSVEILHELQESMTMETLDDPSCGGRFRLPNEEIHVVDNEDGKLLHIPPPAEELNDRVQAMCDFANQDGKSEFIHPVLKAVILHFWLAYDHPYVDGNGRTARALFYWYAMKKDYWLIEYLSVSRMIMKSRHQYYRAFLYAESDDLDITYFIVYYLKALNLAMEELRLYLERKQKEYRESLSVLHGWPGLNYRQQTLLRHALNNRFAIYTFQSHMNSHNIAYATGRSDLLTLVERGLLIENKVGRQFQFLVPGDLHEKIVKNRV